MKELKGIYNELTKLDKYHNYEMLKGSSCFILLRDEYKICFRAQFSDWGDMRYVYVATLPEYEKGRIYASLWDLIQNDKELFAYHIERVKRFELYQDCDVLIGYLKFMKNYESHRLDEINEMIKNVLNVKLSLKRYWTDIDCTYYVYVLLGIVDTITDEWSRYYIPELYFLRRIGI